MKLNGKMAVYKVPVLGPEVFLKLKIVPKKLNPWSIRISENKFKKVVESHHANFLSVNACFVIGNAFMMVVICLFSFHDRVGIL